MKQNIPEYIKKILRFPSQNCFLFVWIWGTEDQTDWVLVCSV